jgi:hypothetical protein
MDNALKVQENRVRRTADRRGFRLEKSRRRDTLAVGFGTYQLIDNRSNTVASIGGGPLTLDEAERQLTIGVTFSRLNLGDHADAEAGSYVIAKPGVVLDIAATGRLYVVQDDGSLKEISREEIEEELSGFES